MARFRDLLSTWRRRVLRHVLRRVLSWWRNRVLLVGWAVAMIGVGVALMQPYVSARASGLTHPPVWSDPIFYMALFLVVAGVGFGLWLGYITVQANRWREHLTGFIHRGHAVLDQVRVAALTEAAGGEPTAEWIDLWQDWSDQVREFLGTLHEVDYLSWFLKPLGIASIETIPRGSSQETAWKQIQAEVATLQEIRRELRS